jgi:hypothetical protein
MSDITSLLLSIVILLVTIFAKPTRGNCPPRHCLDMGITPTGDYRCVPDLMNVNTHPVQPPGYYASRIYCTGGMLPIVTDEGRTVGCQRGHYQF